MRLLTIITSITAVILLAGCGGSEPEDNPTPLQLTAYAGPDATAGVNQMYTLDASGSTNASGGSSGLSYIWLQTSGAKVIWPEGQEGEQVPVILPGSAADVTFQLTVTEGSNSATDEVTVYAEPCSVAAGVVFDECLSAEFGPVAAYANEPSYAGVYFNGEADRHVQWQWVDTGDAQHGTVLEVNFNANDQNHQMDGNGWIGISMHRGNLNDTKDMSAYANGTLAFDMRTVYHEVPNAPTTFIAKMECIHPCTSAELPIAGVQSNYEWATYEFSMAQLIASGLNISSVNHALVIHPYWGGQEQNVTVQIDNIRFLTTYTPPEPQDGCFAAGNVSYTLSRAAEPTADEQDAYNLITTAMDIAVEKYNCYTNLTRAITVQYNPSVATADGSTNGNIRFGSRGSMHYVTAMHEIAHVFGVGGNAYRTLVSGSVFTGAQATAKLREITGDSSAVINTDGTHLWPYGLNYISEGGTEQDLINHCLIIEAMVGDLNAL